MNIEEFMTVEEAAAQLNVARATIYHAVKAGQMRMETVLGRRVVVRADVAAYQPRAYVGKRERVRRIETPE